MEKEKLRIKALEIMIEFLRVVDEEGLDLQDLLKQTDLIEKYVIPVLKTK